MTRQLLAWDLTGRTVLVVGAGSVAERKVEVFLASGARLRVVACDATPRLEVLATKGQIDLRRRRFRPTDVAGAVLVIAATSDRRLNRRVRRWAHLARRLVNVVDDPALCDVTMPAVIRRGGATIAVATDGQSPATARFLREEVERALPLDVSHLVDSAAGARRELRRTGRYRYDYQAWRQSLLEPSLAAIRAGRAHTLNDLAAQFVAGFDAPKPVRAGRVTLVGAGPGGVDLITVRGVAALASADVVIYDRLADPALLTLAPAASERIPVGKAKGSGTDQEEINRLLVARAAQGAHVVRLKGGDPFVFGRGAEEREYVLRAGLRCEVVPGLSSALAGPALAGISVTSRGTTASFTVLSGHRISGAGHDWNALARSATTLIVLMGASSANDLAHRLIAAGRRPEQPVAMIHNAGRTDERTATTTIEGLAADGCPFPAPTVIVIGGAAVEAGRTAAPTASGASQRHTPNER